MAKKDQLTTSDHLPYDEFLRLLQCLHNDGEYFFELFARLSFCTACRCSDVLEFRWKDFISHDKVVITEKKTGKTRIVPLNPSVRQKIGAMYHNFQCPDKEGRIFENPYTHKPVTIQCINQHLKRFKSKYKLQIENFSTHTFRKTFGRFVYDHNNHSAESLLLLNSILNHSSIETTKRYIGITKEEIGQVFASINF